MTQYYNTVRVSYDLSVQCVSLVGNVLFNHRYIYSTKGPKSVTGRYEAQRPGLQIESDNVYDILFSCRCGGICDW